MSTDILNTSIQAGGNIGVIVEMIFMAKQDTNPAYELNLLNELMDDTVSTLVIYKEELKYADSEKVLFKKQRLSSEIENDIYLCKEMLDELQKMISIRQSLFS